MDQEDNNKMFQVSTLQALALGYSRAVINVGELMRHGDIGLGTFEDVDGEMIVIDGHCYRADEKGDVSEADSEIGVPFSSVTFFKSDRSCEISGTDSIEKLKELLDLRIEEDFGLNSMHIIQIRGLFDKIYARSEAPYHSHHVTLKKMLETTQTSFEFADIRGSLVGVYYPDYMDGINAAGWHLHFVSDDRTKGGHVYEIQMKGGAVRLAKKSCIEIQLPKDAAFDTYSLKNASDEEIKQVEQG